MPAPKNLIATAFWNIVADRVILANTNGDKIKQAARAVAMIAVITPLDQLIDGNTVDGLNGLPGAVSTSGLTVGESIALANAIAGLSAVAGVARMVPGQGFLADVIVEEADAAAAAMIAVAQGYIPKPIAPPATNVMPAAAANKPLGQ